MIAWKSSHKLSSKVFTKIFSSNKYFLFQLRKFYYHKRFIFPHQKSKVTYLHFIFSYRGVFSSNIFKISTHVYEKEIFRQKHFVQSSLHKLNRTPVSALWEIISNTNNTVTIHISWLYKWFNKKSRKNCHQFNNFWLLQSVFTSLKIKL